MTKAEREARDFLQAMRLPNDAAIKQSEEYKAYHARVVAECVQLMGEQCRGFFDKQCDYLGEFAEGDDPRDVAISQQECLDG